MFKNILILTLVSLTFQSAFALDKNELNVDFFNRFNDEFLVKYIDESFKNNHSAKQASKRVEQYRQNVKMSFVKELPSFGVSAGYLGVSVPKFNNYTDFEKNAFILPFTAKYEADLFLKNRDKTKSVKKSYEMSILEERAVYLVLLTDVATVYTNVLEYDELKKIAKENVEIYTELLKRNSKKFNAQNKSFLRD